MKVQIKQEHLVNMGITNINVPSMCGLALALQDVTKDPTWMVGGALASNEKLRLEMRHLKLPPEARRFVLDFDLGKAEPCELEIDLENSEDV